MRKCARMQAQATHCRLGARADQAVSELMAEAASMWRDLYGRDLPEEDCHELTRKLLALYGIELPTASCQTPTGSEKQGPAANVTTI